MRSSCVIGASIAKEAPEGRRESIRAPASFFVERSSPIVLQTGSGLHRADDARHLQREIDCHLARNAVLGHDLPEMPDCPLVPKGAEARVRAAENGFVVEVRSDDPAAVAGIVARAERLQPH
jgi:hypothetical protein